MNWIILEASEKILNKMQLINGKSLEAGVTGNIKSMDRYRAELYSEIFTFVNWVTQLSESEKYRY